MTMKKTGRPGVPEAEVRAAADEIAAKGEEPGYKNVHALLGRGSHPLIMGIVNVWRREREANGANELPPAAVEFFQQMHKTSYAEGRAKAQSEIDALRADSDILACELEEAADSRDAAQAEVTRLVKQSDSLSGELKAKVEEIEHLRTAADNARAECSKAWRELATAEQQLETAVEEAALREGEIDRARRDVKDRDRLKSATEIKLAQLLTAHDGFIDRLGDSQRREQELAELVRTLEFARRPNSEALVRNETVN